MPLVEQPDSVINIVLLGSDQQSGSGGRTDVIIVVSVNPDIPSVSMISIPRDYYAWIPTHGYDKINTAESRAEDYPGGGPALVKATIEYNLGIPIHYYARVNFQGFIQIVDALGGVDIPVECELHDTFPDPANPEQGIDIDLDPGIQHLDGQYALWYARSRWSTHDFDRNRRQQQVLRALYHQVMDLDVIGRIPDLWGAIQETVETDLGLNELIWLGLVGRQLDFTNVKSRFIAPPYLTPSTSPSGAYILVPVQDALEPFVAEALRPPAEGRADQPVFRVEVWDGTGRPGMLEVAVARLAWEGFEVVGAQTVAPVPRTQIVDFTTTDKGSPLWLLTRLYDRRSGDIVTQPTEGAPAEFRIILGADYNSCVSMYAIRYSPVPTPTPTPPSPLDATPAP
jgi:LCP family protein required for cell wall assembly